MIIKYLQKTCLDLRSSRIVKTKAYSYALYVYMSAHPLPIEAFGMGIDVTKVMLLSQNAIHFDRQNAVLTHNLTQLNTNM